MKKGFIGMLVITIVTMAQWSFAAGITTPVQYCASLAATSCEVLNWELSSSANSGGSYGTLLVKYCRNQKAGAVILGVSGGSEPSGTSAPPIYRLNLRMNFPAVGSQTAVTALDSASLCAATILVDTGPTYSSLLP